MQFVKVLRTGRFTSLCREASPEEIAALPEAVAEATERRPAWRSPSSLAPSRPFFFGWPVVLAVMIPAVALRLLNDFPLELIGQRMVYALDSFPLVAVPVFIFVGNLMNQAGITERIYRFAHTLVGRVPAASRRSTSSASLVFSGMCGAALADIGGLGRIEIRAMATHGFKPRLRRRDHLRLRDRRADLPATSR